MDIKNIAEEIERRIKALETGRKMLTERGIVKAETLSNYRKAVAITILKLKNGQIMEFEGNLIQGNMAASLIEELARGMCWKEKLAMETAEIEYKSAIVGMDSLAAELNGYQTLNRHLSHL